MKKILTGAVLALGLIGAASAAVNCNTYPNNTITKSPCGL
jgi:opacity protein-like surface antigen